MIICAAIRLKNRPYIEIGCWRHSLGYSVLKELNIDVTEDDVEEGFLSNSGKFMNRSEAYFHAIECGQLSANVRNLKFNNMETELYSEDLY